VRDGSQFGIAGIWENWREPASGEWIRTFAISTTDANEVLAEIYGRQAVILAPPDQARPFVEEPPGPPNAALPGRCVRGRSRRG
jgi:putative SOS response-associated peptidase YedK